jgi:hypothetical protein
VCLSNPRAVESRRRDISVVRIPWTGVAARASGTLPRLPARVPIFVLAGIEPSRRGTVCADGLPCAPQGRNCSASSTGLRGRRGHTSAFPTAPVEERPYGLSLARAVELRAGAALDADLGSGAWRDRSADLRASRGRTRACGYWSPTTGVAHRAETQRSEPPPAHRRRCSAGQTGQLWRRARCLPTRIRRTRPDQKRPHGSDERTLKSPFDGVWPSSGFLTHQR